MSTFHKQIRKRINDLEQENKELKALNQTNICQHCTYYNTEKCNEPAQACNDGLLAYFRSLAKEK